MLIWIFLLVQSLTWVNMKIEIFKKIQMAIRTMCEKIRFLTFCNVFIK